MKTLKSLFNFFIILYVLVCVGLYFAQEKLIFQPHKLPDDYIFHAGDEVKIPVEKDINLSCLWIKENNSKGVILYLHGNRGSNRRCTRQALTMEGNNYDIFMPDYRGYGKSGGEIVSEEQIFSDVQKVYNFLKKHYDENQIVIVGYSLGTGMASFLAANNNPQQMFLVAPYLSMTDLKDRRAPFLPDFILKYPLESKNYIAKASCPITLFHAKRDNVIPYDSSEQLQQINPKNIQFFELNNRGHRGSIFSSVFKNQIRKKLL